MSVIITLSYIIVKPTRRSSINKWHFYSKTVWRIWDKLSKTEPNSKDFTVVILLPKYKNLGTHGTSFYLTKKRNGIYLYGLTEDRKHNFQTVPELISDNCIDTYEEKLITMMDVHYQKLRNAYEYSYRHRKDRKFIHDWFKTNVVE